MIISFFLSLAFLFIVYLLIKMNTLEGRVKGLQYTLKRISKQLDDSEEDPIEAEVRALANDDRDIEAVKLSRETFGYTLVEAKAYVDQLKE